MNRMIDEVKNPIIMSYCFSRAMIYERSSKYLSNRARTDKFFTHPNDRMIN